jgi:predicted transcriptional regulator
MRNSSKLPETSLEANRRAVPEMRTDHHKKIIEALSKLKAANFEVIASHSRLDKAQVSRRLCELERLQLVFNTKIKTKTSTGRSAFAYSLQNNITPSDIVSATLENIVNKQKKQTKKPSGSNDSPLYNLF